MLLMDKLSKMKDDLQGKGQPKSKTGNQGEETPGSPGMFLRPREKEEPVKEGGGKSGKKQEPRTKGSATRRS